MAKYIEREAACAAMPDDYYGWRDKQLLKSIPAADVRPVVLCRDCKWYQIDELKKDGTADRRYKPSVCVLAEQRRDPNHFCADGERRSNA